MTSVVAFFVSLQLIKKKTIMDMTFIIGNIAAVLTSVSFLPQAIQIIKTKDTKSISLPMYILFVIGIVLWLIYGFMRDDIPLIFANIVTLSLSGLILGFKVKAVLENED